MDSAKNKALIRRLVEEVWNEGNASAIDKYFAANLVDEVTQHHRQLLDGFSDIRVEINDLIAEGDKVAVRLMVSGTHDKGPFAAQPASGKKLSWGSLRFYRIAGNKVVDTWAMQDRLGLMQQLGLALPRDTGVQWADGAPT